MELNELLQSENIDPSQVVVLRHRPEERALNRVLPWLAAERHDLFNAYQQIQKPNLESSMKRAEFVASFIAGGAGKALFIGLYKIAGCKSVDRKTFWEIPANIELKKFGMRGFTENSKRSSALWFKLDLTDCYASWKGKLVVGWPPPERSWWRRAHRNQMPILAVHEDSELDQVMPDWQEISLTWEELGVLPTRWKALLSQWRGIYYIFDSSDGKGYVGSAYGKSNLLGRWRSYAASGHGGNKLLKKRDPQHFHFGILQRVSPDMDEADVIQLETTWKQRLHTRAPHGLNDN